jgi:hypothetical protein
MTAGNKWVSIVSVCMVVLFVAVSTAGCGTGSSEEAPKNTTVSNLYVQEAEGGTLAKGQGQGYVLTLNGVSLKTTVFHDRPVRTAEVVDTAAFVDGWKSTFGSSSPNAALTFKTDAENAAVFSLSNPVYDPASNTLTYEATDIPAEKGSEGVTSTGKTLSQLPAEFGASSLFIDSADGNGEPAVGADTTFSHPITSYDTGKAPYVSANNNDVVVEVHQSNDANALWYHVTTVRYTDNSISWGESKKYDTGMNPVVALRDDGVVVEVHMSSADDSNNNLWYHVGVVNADDKTIDWGPSLKYDTGSWANIAMSNDGTVVEVHNAPTVETLWYHVGTVDAGSKTISWGPSHKYDDGKQPAVGLTDNGVAIETHNSGAGTYIWSHVGTVDAGSKTISWGASGQFDYGFPGSVAACSMAGSHPDFVIESHADDDDNNIFYRMGTYNSSNKTISWQDSTRIDAGSGPCVALRNDGMVIVVYENGDRLECRSGRL